MSTEAVDVSRSRSIALGVLLDVDGTLVDSVYLHTIAWQRAFRRHALEVPAWMIHRHIGMGGDHLVEAVAGADVERTLGEAIRETRRVTFRSVVNEVRPISGAARFLRALNDAGMRVSLATSPNLTRSSTIARCCRAMASSIDARMRATWSTRSPTPTWWDRRWI